jgi:hypothetical protein
MWLCGLDSFIPWHSGLNIFDYMGDNYQALKNSDPKRWLIYKEQSEVKLRWVCFRHEGV